MNQQPDKLFREKLEGFNRPAPTGAWDKIDAGLQKKNSKGFTLTWKIAASLLLLAVAAYILWPTAKQQNQVATTKTTEDKSVTKKDVQPPVISPNQLPESVDQTPQLPKQKRIEKQKHKVVSPKEEVVQEQIQNEITPTIDALAMTTQPEEKTIEPLLSTEANTIETVSAETAEADHTLTLVVTAKEADEYLNKKELVQATSKEQKPSTLKKLLKKAGDLTTDQDPFGELRQKKNEILALNFKTEKQRGQNK